jgi:hypothetical protein
MNQRFSCDQTCFPTSVEPAPTAGDTPTPPALPRPQGVPRRPAGTAGGQRKHDKLRAEFTRGDITAANVCHLRICEPCAELVLQRRRTCLPAPGQHVRRPDHNFDFERWRSIRLA